MKKVWISIGILVILLYVLLLYAYFTVDKHPIISGQYRDREAQMIFKPYYLNQTVEIPVEEEWNREEALDAANNMAIR